MQHCNFFRFVESDQAALRICQPASDISVKIGQVRQPAYFLSTEQPLTSLKIMFKTTKRLIALMFALGSSVAYAGDVDVRASVGGQISPGVYGRIEIGNVPPPVVYVEPVIVIRQPHPVPVAPIYMHVPPGHAKKWSKHCHKYHACGQPVYFVKSAEYENDGHHKKKHKHKD